MNKVIVFEMVSLDGYFADAHGDMAWAHRNDSEWNDFVAGNASGGGTLLFGRVTYEMMASFWPTPMAHQSAPIVAKQMNALPKVVFSKTLNKATWNNTRLVKTGIVEEVRRLKSEPGRDLVIMGSGSIVSQLAPEGLVDEYQIIVNPIALGSGRSLFGGMSKRLDLKLKSSRVFSNGNVMICYGPAM